MVLAKNFASTMLVIPLGDVNNNISVPFFLSSANVLIVSIGIINVSMLITGANIASKLIVPFKKTATQKQVLTSSKNNPINTYPTGVKK